MSSAKQLIETFLEGRSPDARYASFDFCFNYFSAFRSRSQSLAQGANLQSGCLHLMSYLGSWGMLRASSRLLREKSMRHFIPLVDLIASGEIDQLWEIDCDIYNDQNIDSMIASFYRIAAVVADENQQTLTLVTKIMLGVFGCCPAFDTRVTTALRVRYGRECGFRRFNKESLSLVARCYEETKSTVNRYAKRTRTIDFVTGKQTETNYTKAKVLDMILFQANGKRFTS